MKSWPHFSYQLGEKRLRKNISITLTFVGSQRLYFDSLKTCFEHQSKIKMHWRFGGAFYYCHYQNSFLFSQITFFPKYNEVLIVFVSQKFSIKKLSHTDPRINVLSMKMFQYVEVSFCSILEWWNTSFLKVCVSHKHFNHTSGNVKIIFKVQEYLESMSRQYPDIGRYTITKLYFNDVTDDKLLGSDVEFLSFTYHNGKLQQEIQLKLYF